ncbi:MAG: hypothetical protein GY696_18025, partial [Gammaproteobacteria bacterium]|nr:hypothetical protein [Gammaproteobacteria bacterium]
MTAERIMEVWAMLKQSDESLDLDAHLQIVITRVSQTRGGRPREPRWDHKAWMKKHCGHGGCFIQVSNPDDDLCLARALVVAKARIDKETDPELARKWKNIQKNRPAQANSIQKRMALALMRQAGLQDHVGPCGEQEIRKLQEALQPDYQIKIFSSRCCNFLTFQGKIPAEKVLHIYHDYDEENDSGHFIIITRPHVIFNPSYWCDSCNSGFADKKQHKCISKCNCCFKLKKCPFVQWKSCSDCNQWFRSDQCFQGHLSVAQPRGENKKARVNLSICQKIRRCLECKRLLNLHNLKKRGGQY